MAESETHPVYIARSRKSEVKKAAVDHDTSMKDITERLVAHGMELGLHELPLDADIEFQENDQSELELVIPQPESESEDNSTDSEVEAE